MTIQDIPYLTVPPINGIGLSASSQRIDTGQAVAMPFYAPKTGTISKLRYATVGVNTGATLDVRLETLDMTTGFPSGTLIATGAQGPSLVLNTDDNVWKEVTLDTPVAVTLGDLICLTIRVGSGSPLALTIANVSPMAPNMTALFPYTARYASSAWTKATSSPTSLVIQYSGDTLWEIPLGGTYQRSSANAAMSNGYDSAIRDEIGLVFSVPVTMRVCGGWVRTSTTGGTDIDFVVYDAFDNVVGVVSLDADVRSTSSNAGVLFNFSSRFEIEGGSLYRMVLKPTSPASTNYMLLTGFEDDVNVIQGGSMNGTERLDGGAWTDVKTSAIAMGLIVDGVEVGGGGGPVASAYGFS